MLSVGPEPMASFSQLLSSLDGDPDKRGKQFECFVKWFLTSDPEWLTQVAQVWLWKEYPNRWGHDCGVDLVFKHKNGQTWAVQAKCYSPAYVITKPDVDKFLSETNRKGIDHRLLIATTDRLGANAKQVIKAQEKPVVRYLRSHFDNAAVVYPDDIGHLTRGKRKAPHNPRKYQLDAIENVVSGFKTAERGQLIMACGTGKTLVSLRVKERLEAERTLVLVPSLGLLSQILNEWTAHARVSFDVLCVCSDQTAGRREEEEDEAISLVSDLAFPVTDPDPKIARKEITQFLKGGGHRVIFSTYQSSPLIADVQQDTTTPCFDLIVADEPHRCAGKVDSAFATVLDVKKLRSRWCLFATATPRTYRRSLKQKAGEIGVEVVDMDDEVAFGKRLHVLKFGEAITEGWLTDYRVVIVGVDDETIAKSRLDALGFIWDPLEVQWEEGFEQLQAFVTEHGHCKVPAKYLTADGYRLGSWVDKQRQRQVGMRAERKARLDALGFIWDPNEALWEEGFEYLRAYVNEHGHCRVPAKHLTADGYPLGRWVNTQRVQEGRMSPERKARLNAFGFVWDALSNKWEEGYQHLQAYVHEHGHCRVPFRYKSADGYQLGKWVNKQRQKQDRMPVERKALLDALGFYRAAEPAPPPKPKHDREVLMVQPDGRLAYVDDAGVVDFRDVVRRHCERKERERRQEMW
jgi:superfamily II DNA or RNA helicase